MTENTTNTEKSRVAADCPNKRLVMLHYAALPILIEFIKECKHSSDESVRLGALRTLNRWDEARAQSRLNAARTTESDMNEFGMYPTNNDEVLRWIAERENATAKMQLAKTQECCRLLISQHDPVFSLGIDREKLKVLLSFVQHHDTARLRRECEALLNSDGLK